MNEKVKNNITEMVFILDRSGSMSGMEQDTIGGFNSMIEKQKKEEGTVYVSTVLFSNTSKVLHDRIDIKEIEPMTERDYQVSGCTALLDAIGGAIHHIANVHKYARKEDVPEKTIFLITTDGMENASREYSSARVKEMIKKQEEDVRLKEERTARKREEAVRRRVEEEQKEKELREKIDALRSDESAIKLQQKMAVLRKIESSAKKNNIDPERVAQLLLKQLYKENLS